MEEDRACQGIPIISKGSKAEDFKVEIGITINPLLLPSGREIPRITKVYIATTLDEDGLLDQAYIYDMYDGKWIHVINPNTYILSYRELQRMETVFSMMLQIVTEKFYNK